MRRPLCLFVLLFVAAVRAAVFFAPPQQAVSDKADGRYVTLRGTVEEKEFAVTQYSEEPELRLTLKSVVLESYMPEEAAFEIGKADKVLCTITQDPQLHAEWAQTGAVLRLRGRIRLFRHPSNDGEFDAFMHYSVIGGYLFRLSDARIYAYNGERNPLRSALDAARFHLSDTLDGIFAEEFGEYGSRCSSVLKAMLLGQNSLVDPLLKERYQAAGIIHVICVSGLHISLIGTAVFSILKKCRVPTAAACAVSAAVLYLYGALTGMHTSCVRALVMFGMRTVAKLLGRTYDMLTAMAVAAALLLIEQPCYLFHVGFLFSFLAVAAAAVLVPALPSAARPLAIPLFTLPVHLCFYYTFPLYSVFLNLIVLFLAPFVMAGGGGALALSLFSVCFCEGGFLQETLSAGAKAAGAVTVMLLQIFDRLCVFTQRLPLSTLIPGSPTGWKIVLYYLMIAAAAALAYHKNAASLRARLVRIFLYSAAVVLIMTGRGAPPFALYMWDVGQGDGLCIRICDESGDFIVLIDGGSSSRRGVGDNIEIPFLKFHGISSVDYCILTHDDLDHCSGLLELLEQTGTPSGIRIGHLGLPSVAEDKKRDMYKKIEETAALKDIPITYLHRGMELTRGKLHLSCIHPAGNAAYDDANAYSVVLLASYGQFSALLTGDLEGEGEEDMLRYLGDTRIRADVLKAAHHGSGGGTSAFFLSKISSRVALISCGEGNQYGHPAPETVKRITEAGIEIFDTRKSGQITVTTDGDGRYSVHTFY